ncbi:MAG: hypothetical protein EZS28_021338 [Streblomastix strix]|uniref:Uncharacterized protein n=1 Tax=Streblomastix strix TaxID=222440 RepID=A0A5J4VKX9_9EUKA|nr:MAG: hypothetical protein EZS28_021338 [Streblomastix strix]
MTQIGLKIINNDSEKDYVEWVTQTPTEIRHNLTTSDTLKIYQQVKNQDNSYKLVFIDKIPPIRVKMNTVIDNMYILDSDRQSYLYNPNVHAVKLADMLAFDDTNEKYFDTINITNSNAICFNGSVNEHTQKLTNNTFKLNINNGSDICSSALNYINLRIDAFLYHYWIYDQDLAFAYRCLGLVRLYEPIANNFMTTCEAHDVGGVQSLKIRYNYGKQITLVNGDIVITDENPINVQQLTMQQIPNGINILPARMKF